VIKTNLSTRPFYNQSAVSLWLAGLAIIVAGATVFNLARIIGYSRSDTALVTQAALDESRAEDLRASAAKLRAGVDPRQIAFASTEARSANDLIDRRTFSWTALFNQFETTLPDDVRITSVRPKLEPKRGIVLTMSVVARRVEDVDRFMQNLEGTGAFRELNPTEDRPDEDGLINAIIESVYKPVEPTRTTGAATK
jgi:type IV pilus assembly protein PilN